MGFPSGCSDINKITIGEMLNRKNVGASNDNLLACKEDELIDFGEQMAYISHFIQNRSFIDMSFEDKAIDMAYKIFNIKLDKSDDTKNRLLEPTFSYQCKLFEEIEHPRFVASDNPQFTFIDLFAGIGGFRLAMQNIGGKCIFSSEWDRDAQKTYFANFGEVPFGDITNPDIKNSIPSNFDVLCAGFPCQAFSIAGYRNGFEDTRGTLFFDIAQILKEHRPKAFFLENVKNLKSHDNGNTFKVIENTLLDLGYCIYNAVLNSMTHANIPQNRERIFIVGFDPDQVPNCGEFKFPDPISLSNTIHNCIDYDVSDQSLFYTESHKYYPMLKEAMINSDTVYQWRRIYVRENQSNVCPTLTANMGEGGHNVPLIITPDGFRKLTPKECLNFQGYPENYEFPDISRGKKYKQAGNSVTVPLVQRIAENIYNVL